jgi:hypothetical protein
MAGPTIRAALLALLFSTQALAHDPTHHYVAAKDAADEDAQGSYHNKNTDGTFQLWGKEIAPGKAAHGVMFNCCSGNPPSPNGDCRVVLPNQVEQSEEGWRFFDGEFIPAGYETLSPDGHMYRCRKNPTTPSHCLFVTKARG